jgi:signal peptidase I
MAKRRVKTGLHRQRVPRGAQREDRSRGPAQRLGRWLWDWAKSISVALLLFLLIRTFAIETFTIDSGSMESTLLVGDFLVVNKAAYGAELPFTDIRLPGLGNPGRGDVVVLEPPLDTWQAPYVKRIVGLPGERLAMRAGALYVNGMRQHERYVQRIEPAGDYYDRRFEWQRGYLAPGVEVATYKPTRDNWGPIRVPEGKYFVMGDNRDNSEDSRHWGFVDRALIRGRPLIIYYSFDRSRLRLVPWLTEVRWERIGDLIQ